MTVLRKFMQLTAVAVVAMLMVSCADEKKTSSVAEKGNMIPDGAVVAMKVNAQQLFDKVAGDPDSEFYEFFQQNKGKMPVDVASLGINVEEPIVISGKADLEEIMYDEAAFDAYLVALLDDSKAFIKNIDDLSVMLKYAGITLTKETVNDDAYYWCNVQEGMYVDMSVSSKAVVVRYKYDEDVVETDLKESIFALFSNGGPQRTDGLDEFYAVKSDIALWMDAETLVNMAMPFIKMSEPAMAAQLNAYVPMYEGASVVADLNFEDGQTVLKVKSFGQEQMKLYASKYNAVPSGRFLEKMPASAVAAGNIAIKDVPGLVKELCEMSEEYAYAFDYLSEAYDVDEKLLAGMPGTITFALDGTGVNSREIPGFMLCMECDRNVWEFAEQFLAEGAEYVEDDSYCINDEVFIYYDENFVTIVDFATMMTAPYGGTESFADTDLGAQIRNGGFVFNLAALPASVLDSIAEEIDRNMTGRDLLEYVSSVVITTAPDFMSTTLTLNMNDKEHNLLEKMVSTVL